MSLKCILDSEMEHGDFWKSIFKKSVFDLAMSLLDTYPENTYAQGSSFKLCVRLQNGRKSPNVHTGGSETYLRYIYTIK